MACPNKVLGLVTIGFGGASFESLPGAEFNPGGEKRKPLTTDQGRTKFATELVNSEVKVDVPVDENFSIDAFGDCGTLQFVGDTGQAWIVRNAFLVERPTIKGGEGKASLTFNGDPAEAT